MSQPMDSACPTRQQLDELEALMQRMLALPVSDEEAAALPPPHESKPPAARRQPIPNPPPWEEPASAAGVPPAPSDLSRPVVLSRPVSAKPVRPAAPSQPQPVIRHERLPLDGYVAVDNQVTLNETTALADPVGPTAPSTWSPPEPLAKVRLPRPRTSAGNGPRLEWWLWPLVWTNRTFDQCSVYLGRTGRWLRGSRGRNWLGWIGIGLLASAGAWALLDWFGWIW